MVDLSVTSDGVAILVGVIVSKLGAVVFNVWDVFSVTSDGVVIWVGNVVGTLDAVVFNTLVVAAVEDVLGSIVVCSPFDDVVFVASEVVVFEASKVVVFVASKLIENI